MEANNISTRIPLDRLRMISIDDLQIKLLLEGDEDVREYNFHSAEQKNEALDTWFGCGKPLSDQKA